MNFLAHAYLSGDNKKILLGNFIGDFIKGKQALAAFDAQVVKGVELHRAIDEFTDEHAVVSRSKDLLRPKYRHYAGVIVDVFYDHFLATHWKKFHPQPLEDFARDTYKTMESFSEVLPKPVKYMLPYMIRGNWLVGYAKISGIHSALSGMANRTTFHSRMEEASADLELHYESFRNDFNIFFPELKKYADNWLSEKS